MDNASIGGEVDGSHGLIPAQRGAELNLENRRGVAPIKPEFIRPRVQSEPLGEPPQLDGSTPPASVGAEPNDHGTSQRLPIRDVRGKRSRKNRKEFRGQNKNRTVSHSQDSIMLCPHVSLENECPIGDRFSHDVEAFLAAKGEDLGETCINFKLFGKCQYGLRCRYLKAHFKDGRLVSDEEKWTRSKPSTSNVIPVSFLQKLRKHQFDFTKSDAIIAKLKREAADAFQQQLPGAIEADASGVEEHVETPPHRRERKVLDFRNKTYLAPLTTVGNLPFRRVCKGFGVDITCGEMAMATSLLQGQKQEWSLVRRHRSETIFGVQVAGNKPDTLVRCAEIFAATLDVDFVDINAGCPLDAVYKSGAGSSLMDNSGKLGRIIRGMDAVLNCPVTIKLRTGVFSHKPTAHLLLPRLAEWGCALGTVHGRSREQRYTKLADWDYIGQCGAARPLPLFGNGDVMSHVEYYAHLESASLDGVMIGRGALIKPWVFEEIRRRDYWDISARERLDIVRDFCSFGLEHWGSDTWGVNCTRRFLLEWMSFAHRYIPVGLLEVLPQGMNDRPPPFFGRNDLETLLASTCVNDWVKLSEMFLGGTPLDFTFVPKHKSNSYEGPQG